MPMPMSSECIHFSKTVQRSNQAEVFITFSSIHREPGSGFTPLMEAAASGHEIIVQNLLDHVSLLLHKCALYHSDTELQHNRVLGSRNDWSCLIFIATSVFFYRTLKSMTATLKERLPGL